MHADRETILVAMSGGVDSSTVAALLHRQGYKVIGVSLRLYHPEGEQQDGFAAVPAFGSCCSLDDLAGARRIAEELGIPHYTLDMVAEFNQNVYRNFLAEYSRGRTPSPCVRCNDLIKFERLFDLMNEVGAAALATGHYARVEKRGSQWLLRRGVDAVKDQSYFLARTPAAKLARVRFPLGEMTKPEVRSLAAEMQIRSADKPDSQDLCFIPGGDTRGFLDQRIDPVVGRLMGPEGVDFGPHGGIHRYTPGQRKGLGVSWREPLYVKRIEIDGTVRLAARAEVRCDRFRVTEPVWVNEPPAVGEAYEIQIRYRSRSHAGTISAMRGNEFVVQMEQPVFAPAPGQLVALFRDDVVLGGGWLDEVLWE